MAEEEWGVRLINQDTGQAFDLTGAYTAMTVCNHQLVDRAKAEGYSGSKKQPQGYDDGQVSLTMTLLEDQEGVGTVLEQLENYRKAFRVTTAETPPVFTIVSPHTRAQGIFEVLWVDLTSDEDNYDNSLSVRLSLVEYNPEASIDVDDPEGAPSSNPTDQTNGNSGNPIPDHGGWGVLE